VHGGHSGGLFWHPPVRWRFFIWAAIFGQGAGMDFYGLERAPLYPQTFGFT
jgi:hypothetical protein